MQRSTSSTQESDVTEGKTAFLTEKEAAEHLGVSLYTLRSMEIKGGLIPFRTLGGHCAYSRKMLNEHLKESDTPPDHQESNAPEVQAPSPSPSPGPEMRDHNSIPIAEPTPLQLPSPPLNPTPSKKKSKSLPSIKPTSSLKKTQPPIRPPAAPKASPMRASLSSSSQPPLKVLSLSSDPYNILVNAGITTVEQLATMSLSEILSVPRIDYDRLAKIRRKLEAYLAVHPLPTQLSPSKEKPKLPPPTKPRPPITEVKRVVRPPAAPKASPMRTKKSASPQDELVSSEDKPKSPLPTKLSSLTKKIKRIVRAPAAPKTSREESIQRLVAEGKKRGFVTYEGITALFSDEDAHLDEIDDLCLTLIDLGVEIVAEASIKGILEASVPAPAPVRAPLPQRFESTEDLYDLYMLEIRQVGLLTAEDEVRLAKLIRQGERAGVRLEEAPPASDRARLRREIHKADEARQQFVEANLRLVAHIAYRYRDQGVRLLDLMQEGNIGLLKAVDKFDHRLGHRFSTYATWWIRQAIQRALADQSNTIRLPVHVLGSLRKVTRAAEEVKRQLGEEPTKEQVAQHCGMSRKQVAYLLEELPEVCSLDSLLCCSEFPLVRNDTGIGFVQQQPCPAREFALRQWFRVTEDDDFELPPCIASVIDSREKEPPDYVDYSLSNLSKSVPVLRQAVAYKLLRARLREVLGDLSPRQRTVIEMRFGLDGGGERSLKVVGQRFDLTRERIRQIQGKAITRLKHPIRKRRLWQFYTETGN